MIAQDTIWNAKKISIRYNDVVVGKILIALSFFIPLELILENLFSIETVFKPYRVVQLILIVYFIRQTGLGFIKFSPFSVHLLLFIAVGLIATIIQLPLGKLNGYLFFNWLGIFAINSLTFLIMSFVRIPSSAIKYCYLAFLASLFINLIAVYYLSSGQLRDAGFFDNFNSLGIASALGVIFLFDLLERRWISKIPFLFFMGVCFFLVNESGSRASLAVFAIVLLFLTFGRLNRLIFAVLAALLIVVFSGDALIEKVQFNALERQKSKEQRGEDEIRFVLAMAALEAFEDTNYVGVGISQFQNIENFYQYVFPFNRSLAYDRREKGSGLVSHSTFIQVLAEFGAVGLVIFALFIVRMLKLAFMNRAYNSPNVFNNRNFLIVCALLVYSITHVIFLNPIFWFFTSLACNPNFNHARVK